MNARVLAGLVFVAAAGFAAVALLRSAPDERAPAATAEPRENAADSSAELSVAPASADAASAAGRTAGRAPSDDGAASPAEDVLLVEVVDAATLAPLAGAEVAWRAATSSAGDDCVALSLPDDAPRARAGSDGVARLAVPRGRAVELVARVPGLLGEARVAGAGGERRARVLAHPDWDALVEVVDDAGRPAPLVPVIARQGGDWQRELQSDERGRVLFAGVGHELARHGGAALELRVPLAFGAVVETVERAPPGGVVRIELPLLGAIEALVLDEGGEPVAGALVTLRETSSRAHHETTQETLEHGATTFERVAVGAPLELSARAGPARARERRDGPASSGEVVYATLRLGMARTTLRFRAVDEEGAPVSGELHSSHVTDGRGSWMSGGAVRADERGLFEVEVDSAMPDGAARSLEVRARDRNLLGRVELDASLPPGVVERGDLVLAARRTIASGRVVGEDGAPVPRVGVHWRPAAGEDVESARRALFDGARTGEDGAFTLVGEPGVARVELAGAAKGLTVEPRVVAVGSTGVELRAVRLGRIRGSLLLDAEVPPRSLRVTLDREDRAVPEESLAFGSGPPDSADLWSDGAIRRRADGGFESWPLAPGRYALRVRCGADRVADATGLVLAPGAELEVPPIDLRGRLRTLRVGLFPPSGVFLLVGSVRLAPAGTEDWRHAAWIDGSPELVTTALGRVDALVRVQGCRIERVADVGATTEVRLRRGLPLRLALPAGVELPGPPLALSVALDPDGLAVPEPAYFGARREVALVACEPGRIPLRWYAEELRDGTSAMSPLDLETWIDVAEASGEQRIELPISREALDAALRKAMVR